MPNFPKLKVRECWYRYLRLAEISVGQLLPQFGCWMCSDHRHTAKAIRTTMVITTFARMLSLTNRRFCYLETWLRRRLG
jgi:hypothetical protein